MSYETILYVTLFPILVWVVFNLLCYAYRLSRHYRLQKDMRDLSTHLKNSIIITPETPWPDWFRDTLDKERWIYPSWEIQGLVAYISHNYRFTLRCRCKDCGILHNADNYAGSRIASKGVGRGYPIFPKKCGDCVRRSVEASVTLKNHVLDEVANEDDEVDLCVVCQVQPRTHVIYPCKHRCLCSKCARVLYKKTTNMHYSGQCPLCRVPFAVYGTFKRFTDLTDNQKEGVFL